MYEKNYKNIKLKYEGRTIFLVQLFYAVVVLTSLEKKKKNKSFHFTEDKRGKCA